MPLGNSRAYHGGRLELNMPARLQKTLSGRYAVRDRWRAISLAARREQGPAAGSGGAVACWNNSFCGVRPGSHEPRTSLRQTAA